MDISKLIISKLFLLIFWTSFASAQIWVEKTMFISSNKANSHGFGASVSMTDSYVLVGARAENSGGVWNAGAAYILTFSGSLWTQQAYLTASNKEPGAWFGEFVSLTDNYAMIGARQAKPNALVNAGSAYIFVRSGTTWTEQAIMTASNKEANDEFGASVSLTDNYALVGARSGDPGGIPNAGAAYVFVRSGTNWTEQAILTASNKSTNARFGIATSLTNNYALIGADGANPGGLSGAGSVYVFGCEAGPWVEQKILTASNKASGDGFGSLISTIFSSALVRSARLSFIFTASGNNWVEAQILTASGPVSIHSSYAMIGNQIYVKWNETWLLQSTIPRTSISSVAISNSYAMIGNMVGNTAGWGAWGEVYVIHYIGITSSLLVDYCVATKMADDSHLSEDWIPQAVLQSPEPQPSDYFGVSASISNTYAIVGAPGFIHSNASIRGVAYIYSRSGFRWMFMKRLEVNSTDANTSFGCSVALTNTVTAVGALLNWYEGNAHSGRVHLFTRQSQDWVYCFCVNPSSPTAHLLFGLNVFINRLHLSVLDRYGNEFVYTRNISIWQANSMKGVYTVQNVTEDYLILSGQNSDTLGRHVIIYAHKVNYKADSWSHMASLTAHDGGQDDGFGNSGVLDGEDLMVGSPQKATSGLSKAGVVYHYQVSGNTISFKQRIVSPFPKEFARFGSSLSLSRHHLIVGAPYDEIGDIERAGAAYIFKWDGSRWDHLSNLSADDASENAKFGASVAIFGPVAIVGSPVPIREFSGSIYVFSNSTGVWLQKQKITPLEKKYSNQFGIFVAIENDIVYSTDVEKRLLHKYSQTNGLYSFDGIQLFFNQTFQKSLQNDRFRIVLDPDYSLNRGIVHVEYNPANFSPSRKSNHRKHISLP